MKVEQNGNVGAARKAFLAACGANDAPTARRELLAWARAHWPDAPPAGLTALAQRVDAHQATLLRELDRACYAGGIWQGGPLAEALTPFAHTKSGPQPENGLAPLYR